MKALDLAVVAHVSTVCKYHREHSCMRFALKEREYILDLVEIYLGDVDESVLHTDALEKLHRFLTVGTVWDFQYDHGMIDQAIHLH